MLSSEKAVMVVLFVQPGVVSGLPAVMIGAGTDLMLWWGSYWKVLEVKRPGPATALWPLSRLRLNSSQWPGPQKERSTSIMCLFAVFWLSGDTIVLFIYQMQLLTSLFFSPTSSGPGQVGPVDRWAKDCSPHMQRYAVQWDHRAHWEHGTLRGTDGAPHQAHYFHQSYWQECLH